MFWATFLGNSQRLCAHTAAQITGKLLISLICDAVCVTELHSGTGSSPVRSANHIGCNLET